MKQKDEERASILTSMIFWLSIHHGKVKNMQLSRIQYASSTFWLCIQMTCSELRENTAESHKI
jgi:hypothetical protein